MVVEKISICASDASSHNSAALVEDYQYQLSTGILDYCACSFTYATSVCRTVRRDVGVPSFITGIGG
jgi:hypothetical protein